MRIELTLKDVLEHVAELPWDHHLYLESGEPSLDSAACVLNADDEELDIHDEPLFASERGMQYYLCVQDVQSIVENLHQQIENPPLEQVLSALTYYYKNDAFVQPDNQ